MSNNNSNPTTSSVFLQTSRAKQFDYIKQLGKTQIVTKQSSLAQRGGFYCSTCDVLLKDSRSFTIHCNGRKHLKMAGKSIYSRRVKYPEVATKLLAMKIKWLSLNPQFVEFPPHQRPKMSSSSSSPPNLTKLDANNVQSIRNNDDNNNDNNNEGIYVTILHRLLQTQNEIDHDAVGNEFHERDEIDNGNITQYDIDQNRGLKRQKENNQDGYNSHRDEYDHNDDDNNNNNNNYDNVINYQNYDMWHEINDYFNIPNKPNLIRPPYALYSQSVNYPTMKNSHDDSTLLSSNEINSTLLGSDDDDDDGDDDDEFDPWADNSKAYSELAQNNAKPKSNNDKSNISYDLQIPNELRERFEQESFIQNLHQQQQQQQPLDQNQSPNMIDEDISNNNHPPPKPHAFREIVFIEDDGSDWSDYDNDDEIDAEIDAEIDG